MFRRRERLVPIALALIVAIGCSAPTIAQATHGGPEGAEAVAFLNEQRARNGIPPVADNQRFASAWCPNEDNGPAGGEIGRDEGGTFGWSSTTSPYDGGPLHQQHLYNPLFTQAGDVNVGVDGCFGAGALAPEPIAPAFYDFISESGNGAVPASETINGEGPFAPQQAVGLRLGVPTGPNILLFGVGSPQESYFNGLHAIAWSLAAASGEPVSGVKFVDGSTVANYGYPGILGGDVGIMIPPVLRPATGYLGSVLWQGPSGATATQTFAFTTTLTRNKVELRTEYRYNRAGRWTGRERVLVTSLASNPSVTASPVGKRGGPLSVRLHLTSREPEESHYEGTIRLAPGLWQICAQAGGPPTQYEADTACQRFRVAHHVARIR